MISIVENNHASLEVQKVKTKARLSHNNNSFVIFSCARDLAGKARVACLMCCLWFWKHPDKNLNGLKFQKNLLYKLPSSILSKHLANLNPVNKE